MGGVVDSLLLEGGFMCVGMHARGQVPVQQPGAIKICHLESASQHLLEGHKVCGLPRLVWNEQFDNALWLSGWPMQLQAVQS